MTLDQRQDLIDCIADALSDRNDVDVTWEKYAAAVVEELQQADSDVRAALWSLLTETPR